MDGGETWKQLKIWHNVIRTLEKSKRRQIINRLERQVHKKKKKYAEKKKEYAAENYKRKKVNEILERRLREKREELEIKKLKHLDLGNDNDYRALYALLREEVGKPPESE